VQVDIGGICADLAGSGHQGADFLAQRRYIRVTRKPSSLLKNPSPAGGLDDSLYHLESLESSMRGRFVDQGGLFSYVEPEARVPANHPLRKIRELVRDVLNGLNRHLGKLYASEGRPSIAPGQLLSALLLQVSERQLMEQLDYNLLYHWFVGFRPTTRSGTRPRSRRTATGCKTAKYLQAS
jgi:hypothetical protein